MISFTLSNISPPVFIQPLPDTLPIPPIQPATIDPLPQTLPHISQIKESIPHDALTSDYAGSPGYPSPVSDYLALDSLNNFSSGPEFSSIDYPPPSAFPSETSSALVSDSELLPPSSTKATKQTDLHNFFSKVPAEEFHAGWRKRKRDNEQKDKEEHAERKKKDDAERLVKKARRREQNRLAQMKRRAKLKGKAKIESRADTEEDTSVSPLFYFEFYWSYTHNCLGRIYP